MLSCRHALNAVSGTPPHRREATACEHEALTHVDSHDRSPSKLSRRPWTTPKSPASKNKAFRKEKKRIRREKGIEKGPKGSPFQRRSRQQSRHNTRVSSRLHNVCNDAGHLRCARLLMKTTTDSKVPTNPKVVDSKKKAKKTNCKQLKM